jgi:hypothetical protein
MCLNLQTRTTFLEAIQLLSHATACAPTLQALRDDKDAVESEIASLAAAAAKDLGLVMDKTIKLEWHKVITCSV